MQKPIKIIIILSSLTATTTIFATEFGKMQIAASPYLPRIYLSGYGGTNWLGQLDFLAPIFVRDDKNLFLYAQGRLANKNEDWQDDTWVGSFGLGYRQMLSSFVLGGYLFADYNNSPIDNNFWTISPGLEAMSNKWDFRVNGYFTAGTNKWQNNQFASNMGNYDYVYFNGHEQYDHLFQNTEEAAKYGFDGQVGYRVLDIYNTPIKVFINGYHFSTDDNVNGIGGKITWDPWRYLTISLNYSYDNVQENTFTLGLRINLAVSRNYLDHMADNSQLQARLYEPIERNFGTLGIANTVQENKTSVDLGDQTMLNNIWFFNPNTATASSNSGIADGTYENPYDAFNLDQKTVDHIANLAGNDKSYLYLSPGSYDANANIELHTNQSLYGRTADFTAPATDQPVFYGALTLDGNNTVEAINFQNIEEEFATGITIKNGANDVYLNNIIVGNTDDESKINSAYHTGISMAGANVTIDNSKIYAYAYGRATGNNNMEAMGINMINGGILNIHNSTISSTAHEISDAKDYTGNGYGIRADGNAETINITDSSIYASGMGGANNSGNGVGIYFGKLHDNSPTANVIGNTLNLNHTQVEGFGYSSDRAAEAYVNISGNGYGILFGSNYALETYSIVEYLDVESNQINLTNGSNISAHGEGENLNKQINSSNNGYGLVIGVEELPSTNLAIINNNIMLDHSNITAHGNAGTVSTSLDSGNAYGILLGCSEIDFNNTIIITNNKLLVQNNSQITVETTGYYSYSTSSAFGIVLGAGIPYTLGSIGSYITYKDNTITLKNKVVIDAAATYETLGIYVGDRYRGTPASYINTNNIVQVSADNPTLANSITLNTPNAAPGIIHSYGIFMDPASDPKNAGSLTVTDTVFTSSTTLGYELHGPDGSVTPW
jgi:hypothetical protein